jgi:oligopeptide/dipeptide ABC transporter ATP-binding protein
MEILKIKDLKIRYRVKNGIIKAADIGLLNINKGETFGLVGESGCGKSTTIKAIMRILPENGYIENGDIIFENTNISKISEDQMNKIRWAGISIIPQSAMNALDPVYTIRDQITEAIKKHKDYDKKTISKRIAELMEMVGLKPDRADGYPHQFSGGMRQRAAIAMALALNQSLIIADEPTTALDVLMQDQILEKILNLHKQFQMAMLMITHDIAVVAQTCQRMGVMYAGNIVETGTVNEIFEKACHPYTIGLLNAFPSIQNKDAEIISIPGAPPSLLNPPAGCRFLERCPWGIDEICIKETPWIEINEGHFSACHRLEEISRFRKEAKDYNIWESKVNKEEVKQ